MNKWISRWNLLALVCSSIVFGVGISLASFLTHTMSNTPVVVAVFTVLLAALGILISLCQWLLPQQSAPKIARHERRFFIGSLVIALVAAVGYSLYPWKKATTSARWSAKSGTPVVSPTATPTAMGVPIGTLFFKHINPSPDALHSVAWSPNGKRIAVAYERHTVQVWTVESSMQSYILLYTYTGHTANVNAVTWSPDGTRIASGSWDKTVQIWTAHDGRQTVTYRGDDQFQSVAWSPDGKRMASGSFDFRVQVWSTDGSEQSLTPMYIYPGHVSVVNAVAWSPDGKRIASGSRDSSLQVWSAGY